MGLVEFYRLYTKLLWYSKTSVSIIKKECCLVLRRAAVYAFQQLCLALTADTCLALPDMGKPFRIHCDASRSGFGAGLMQDFNGKLRSVAFASRTLSKLNVITQ